jgi:23S rRNA (adenine2503-C2)-methyltransferase
VAGRSELAELVAAIREHADATRDRVTVAWVLIGGVNTGDDEVEGLRALLGQVPLRVNLIDVNDATGAFARAEPGELRAFLDRLQVLGVPVVRRYSVGRDKHSACGMLAARRAG